MDKVKNNDYVSVHFERYNSLVAKYGKEKVEETIGMLAPHNKEIMCLYFGLNGEKLSVREIANRCNREPYNVRYHLSFCINKIDELLGESKKIIPVVDRKEEFFNKYKNYSEEEIINAFNKMDGLGKEVILSYYGIGRECLRPVDISDKYDMKYHTVYNYLKNGLKIFERNLNDKGEEKEIFHTPEQFYFKFKGVLKEEVDAKLLELDEKTSGILKDFYGLNGNSIGVNEIAKKYNLDSDAINNEVNSVVLNISKSLKEDKKEETRKKEFYSMFEGVSEEQINQALKTLDERRQDILRAYYGINGSVLTMEAIGEKYSLTRARINQIMKGDIDKLKEILKSPEEKKKEKREEFYQKFKGYSKEEINDALFDLKKRDREIICYYYGFENELLDIHELASKYYLSYSAVSSLIKKKMDIVSKMLRNPSLKREIGKKGFYKKFGNFTKDQVDEAFNKLDHYDRRLLSLYYGLEDECLTMKEVAKRFNIEEAHVNYYLESRIKRILNILEHPDGDKGSNKEEFYGLFKGYSARQIKQAMMGLNRKSFDAIVMYYGLNGEAKSLDYIAKKYNSYKSVVSETINKGIKTIRNGIIENMKQRFLVDVNGEDIVIIKKAMKNLNENDIKLISLYYGLNGKDIMSKLEMSEKFNVDEAAVEKRINEILETIKNNLSRNKR